ncbi:hypothetical protein NP590_11645 [Methylomonas sp. SURF-2]|uniref:Proline-rich region n=1 Tax=Methylomonas subterranea TaxID=2952225 RepID=A0ABT1THM4_9GAMM|nr:hypothetical protein [Methylomonas sp. SURF-2]MCQ8104761.1 hypothetical protein [Methylomonas sp. SURF-2]
MLKPIVFLLLVGSILAGGAVQADHRHRHGGHWGGGFHAYPRYGFYFGLPLYPRAYYPYPYQPYYPPTVVTVPSSPPVYIERPAPPMARQQFPAGYWYYCNNPEGYYPYVTDCPAGWRQVDPVPQR